MIRKAASILLTRDPDSTEVYLVKRNPKLKFFGGYFAFPGGTLDAKDEDLKIKNALMLRNDMVKYLGAAAREVFEETGILLSRGEKKISDQLLRDYRQKLLADEITFSKILINENHVIDATEFNPICSILTPEFAPVRYETQFFWAKIPHGMRPEIWPGELMSGDFYKAEEALSFWKKGQMLIAPPIIIMLQELVGQSVKSFSHHLREIVQSYRQGKIHLVYFTPGVQMITLQTRTIPPATYTNTYLVGESQMYIVDPAPSEPKEQKRLWEYLDTLIKEGGKLKGILLTHHHPDHIGALKACQERYDLPILGHRETAVKLPHIQFTRHLNHGDKLDLGHAPDGPPDWKLKVYHTPGHAMGHLSFQETRYGAIIAGDMISTVSTIVISPPEGHLTTYLHSLEFLEKVTTGMLYPSHGPPFRDGRKIIQYYIKHRKEREDKLLKALSKSPQSSFDLVKIVYDDVDPQLWPLAERSLLAGLIKLIEEGKCQKIGDKYQTC